MTDLHKERVPLLCDECSDEEILIKDSGTKFQRRFRRSFSTGRAKTHAVGATAIITRWPDHISSLLAYWWISLGMIAIMVFLIYNSFLAIAVVPSTYFNPLKSRHPKYNIDNKTNENPNTPNVYMHIFVGNYNEFNYNYYLPYVQAIAKKYTNFKYNFLVVLNDASQDILNNFDDEKNNEIALNTLWTDNTIINEKNDHGRPTVKFVSLTNYMDNSPLKKHWRLLSHQLISFIARCIAIWDKGGIAFDPLILTPNSPNSLYLQKLYSVLENYQSNKKNKIIKKRKMLKNTKKKLNNIRDIINNIENTDESFDIFTDKDLSVAESIQTAPITSLKLKRSTNTVSYDQHNVSEYTEKKNDEIFSKNNSTKDNVTLTINKSDKSINSTKASGAALAEEILPKFLEYFFHFNSKNFTSPSENFKNFTKDIIKNTQFDDYLQNYTTVGSLEDLYSETKTNFMKINSNQTESVKLIMDLKGNLIATKVACHAFIGTIFSNILHHTDDQTLTDFIVSELSLFCKGSLSSCNNIEVILL